MKDFEMIRNLVGEDAKEQDFAFVDCYVRPKLGLFIPSAGACGYASRDFHTHPSYMIVVYFHEDKKRQTYYDSEITSPDIPHCDRNDLHYYCLLIEKEYFENCYAMYANTIPVFKERHFEFCSDILKALNTFAFEYSKSMMNSDITLDAQAQIITHWIVRSILGETMDMRAISSDYSVARAQHYMEQHFQEHITVSKLAQLGYISVSCLNRRFKQELGVTPIEYLIDLRIEKAKTLLRRKNISMTEIAMRCGFGSSGHFSSCFQKHLHITPSEYQDKYRE